MSTSRRASAAAQFTVLTALAATSVAISSNSDAAVIATPYGCNSQVTVKAGYNGECARAVQWTMNSWITRTSQKISKLTVSGSFDATTMAAVKKFQSANGLVASGVIDSKSWPALIKEASAGTKTSSAPVTATPVVAAPGQLKTPFGCNTRYVLTAPTTGECVKAVAYSVNSWNMKSAAGFALLPTDGVFTGGMQTEIKAFQKAQGLNQTGSVDAATWRAIEKTSQGTATSATFAIPAAAGLKHQAFPGAVKLTDGRLMAVVRGAASHLPTGTNATSLWKAYSPDNGYTWTTPEKVNVTVPGSTPKGLVAYTDPSLSVPKTGVLAGRPILTFFTYAFATTTSSPAKEIIPVSAWVSVAGDKNGTSWGTPQAFNFNTSGRNAMSSAAEQLDDTHFIAAGYGVVSAPSTTAPVVFGAMSVGMTWSGQQFTNAAATPMGHPTLAYGMSEPNLLPLRDGRILGLIRVDPNSKGPAAGSQSNIFRTYSSDKGKSWSTPVQAFQGSGNPHVTQLANGTLVVAYRHLNVAELVPGQSRDYKFYAVYRTSRDGGLTWSSEQRIGPVTSQSEMTYAVPVEYAPNKVTFVWGDESANNTVSVIRIGTADFN